MIIHVREVNHIADVVTFDKIYIHDVYKMLRSRESSSEDSMLSDPTPQRGGRQVSSALLVALRESD